MITVFSVLVCAAIVVAGILPASAAVGNGSTPSYDGKPGVKIGDVCINSKDGAEMVWVPAGEFLMGSSDKEIADVLRKKPSAKAGDYDDEKPQRKVYMDGYWMYKHKVTVGQYRKFCESTGHRMITPPEWGKADDHPVVYISWQDAADYAKWAAVSLPTEAQWEKAARGTDGRIYPWGNVWPLTSAGSSENESAARVSPYGCLDMAGKVAEFCADWYDSNRYSSASSRNPVGPLTTPVLESSGGHIFRGSSENADFDSARCANRDSTYYRRAQCYVGFRCAVKLNRLSGQAFIFNQDCRDVVSAARPGRAQSWIRNWFRRAFAAGAGVFVADIALPDLVITKDTPTGEIIGERHGVEYEDLIVGYESGAGPHSRIPWYRRIAELQDQNTDVLHLASEEARKVDAIVLVGMRMSDAHQGAKWAATSDDNHMSLFMMAHPEWCNTWKDGTIDATLNYAIPEVRAHRLQILRELVTNYDVDGVELDWMRWCRNFPEGTGREHLKDLTLFVSQVRKMLDEVAKKKGVERFALGHRVPVTVDECLNIGCDVETWAKNGYADYLAPMDYLMNDLNLRTDEFEKIAEGTNCLVYPAFGGTRYSFGKWYLPRESGRRRATMRSYDQFRATAANWYAWGATGGSSYNFYLWQPEQQEYYTEAIRILSDTKKAFAGPRHYVYMPVWQDHNNGIGPTGRWNAQSLTFDADAVGKRQIFTFRMADGRKGEKLDGVLRMRIYGATAEDDFAIDLNGEPISTGKFKITHHPDGETAGPLADCLPGDGTFDWPANLRFDVSLADCPAFKGDNELGITLVKKNQSGVKDLVMEALEVQVR